jgi:hypothetical protein
MNAKISESLGLVTMSEAKQMEEYILPDSNSVSTVEDDNEAAEAAADRKFARDNIKEVIEHGTSAMGDILDIAKATEDPRAFEVFSNIMKSLIDANKSLVSINNHSAKKATKQTVKEEAPDNNNNNVTNQLFVGSTQELMDLINNRDK